jgi:hypothetical protein
MTKPEIRLLPEKPDSNARCETAAPATSRPRSKVISAPKVGYCGNPATKLILAFVEIPVCDQCFEELKTKYDIIEE